MIPSIPKISIRRAGPEDHHPLAFFLNSETQVHRHLDWRTALEWLGSQPYLLAEQDDLVEAVLACPPDPPDVAWIRLFCAAEILNRNRLWNMLLEQALKDLSQRPGMTLAAICLQDWFERLLVASGFKSYQDIVVLEWSGQVPQAVPTPTEITIRPMTTEDLPQVQKIDEAAFDPLWRNSMDSLQLAFEQSVWSTVAVNQDGIIAYQISTAISLNGHLARLAVQPGFQRSHVGHALVRDLLEYFHQKHAWRVTVNTQSDNFASLSLYQKTGFYRTGEVFHVYQYPVDP